MAMDHSVTRSAQGLDDFLPTWDFREQHRRRIDAPASQVRAALLAITPRELPLSGCMLAIRLAPAFLAARRWPRGLHRPFVEGIVSFGFVELVNEEEEIAFGAIGQFWRLREETVPLSDADAFTRFDEPGFVKGAINFRIVEDGQSTRLTTETRVTATDDGARRSFRPYWVPVRVIGGLMRREMLWAVDRRVKRTPASR
jgi:hypothetical protein